MSHYDVALICLNGHLITGSSQVNPEVAAKHCEKCGESTIVACPSCDAPIRGDFYKYVDDWGTGRTSLWQVPNHCHNCGKPYPWTQRKAEAVREMVDQLDGLDDDEREKLKGSIADIIADTPKSETAALRFKKAAAKVGKAGGQFLMNVIKEVATDAVRKSMGLG